MSASSLYKKYASTHAEALTKMQSYATATTERANWIRVPLRANNARQTKAGAARTTYFAKVFHFAKQAQPKRSTLHGSTRKPTSATTKNAVAERMATHAIEFLQPEGPSTTGDLWKRHHAQARKNGGDARERKPIAVKTHSNIARKSSKRGPLGPNEKRLPKPGAFLN
jgi:hypothetical protein